MLTCLRKILKRSLAVGKLRNLLLPFVIRKICAIERVMPHSVWFIVTLQLIKKIIDISIYEFEIFMRIDKLQRSVLAAILCCFTSRHHEALSAFLTFM
ncbi:uncharacterized protein PHALS_15261 [Plasmopara halstedii]|uniref:Uncharacterized protein n=1 Tax=Plasmopara halstedii TaxID=4781 RepID=A0A0P1AVA0_PLAHL|nr:uncharacterized protein PHALS_15261 [Plasmopara halstedii]CEG44490.1 hypothetical protein PHALS_15261 [Plasmopara halstedii]|eukprot:XP_024580859.1 hypothetical protein PHALS_15261 [Plasmopara halstedii]